MIQNQACWGWGEEGSLSSAWGGALLSSAGLSTTLSAVQVWLRQINSHLRDFLSYSFLNGRLVQQDPLRI